MLILIPIYANRTADMVALDFKKLFFRLIPNFDIFGTKTTHSKSYTSKCDYKVGTKNQKLSTS